MQRALLACHLGAISSTIWLCMSLDLGRAATLVGLVLGTAPLVLALPGLIGASRYTRQWLAIAVVFYVGAALAETIASPARAPAAIALLLTGSLELIVLLRLLTIAPPGPPESTES